MVAVEVSKLGKRYRLGEGFHGYRTLRESISSMLRPGRGGIDGATKEIWALRDVDLEVSHGDVVGVIGRNGAGKTTLLKVLARITEPTEGVARTRGRVGALLDVGTGFHPELTGRENVYLNGAVLGMTRRDVRRRFDEIVAFAEVERFLDTPLKRFSSGMYLRLAFAVAAHLEPDVVVVDEILAVGDAEFQRRCLGKMSQFGREGRTVLFVSHDLGAVAQLCGRSVWLDRGTVRFDGPTDRALELYAASSGGESYRREFVSDPSEPIHLLSVEVTDETGKPRTDPRRDEPLTFQFRFRLLERVPALDLGFRLTDERGARVMEDYWSDTLPREHAASEPGDYDVHVTIPPILPATTYLLEVWIGSTYDELRHRDALSFRLLPGEGDRQEAIERRRLVQSTLKWAARPRVLEESR
ncbi:MAG: ABC transporter ATP-binding protein [Propionibacteriales bacterium]|nr:ABC transporter ATP-binding protein [Propionibacteriales bacterium]